MLTFALIAAITTFVLTGVAFVAQGTAYQFGAIKTAIGIGYAATAIIPAVFATAAGAWLLTVLA